MIVYLLLGLIILGLIINPHEFFDMVESSVDRMHKEDPQIPRQAIIAIYSIVLVTYWAFWPVVLIIILLDL